MIWNDARIIQWAEDGGVTPFDPSLVDPGGLSIRLGNTIRIPRLRWQLGNGKGKSVNKRTPASELWDDPIEFAVYTLKPGQFVLCHSLEYTKIPITAAATLYSKSSTGRLGLEHLHAGWGDPGFEGQWVFELKNMALWDIDLVACEAYMQLVINEMIAPPIRDYSQTGRYQGQTGPEAHR